MPAEGIDVARDWPKKRAYLQENGKGAVKGKGKGRGKGAGNGGNGPGRDQSAGGSRVDVMVKESMGNGIGKGGNV